MNIWKVLGNIGTFIKIGKLIEAMIKNTSGGSAAPSKAQVAELIDHLIKLIAGDLIKMDDQMKINVVAVMEEVKKEIVG